MLCPVNVKRVARGHSEALSDPPIKSERDILMTAIISECAAGNISRLFWTLFFQFPLWDGVASCSRLEDYG